MIDTKSQLREVTKDLCKRKFSHYMKRSWGQYDPASYSHNWHVDAIGEHLEAVARSEIRRLIISIPPRCMKSSSLSIAFPTWLWGPLGRPQEKILSVSHKASLAERDAVKSRILINSDWYQNHWGDSFQFTKDQNTKNRMTNNKHGHRIVGGTDSGVTGEGGDLIIIDDPISVNHARSVADLESAWQFCSETLPTRLNDQMTGRMVIIMQRVHERDPVGRFLEQGGWDYLCLPMRAQKTVKWFAHGSYVEVPTHEHKTSIGFVDTREEGELLWPTRLPEEAVAGLEHILGTYGSSAQLQQDPAPRTGGMLQGSWFFRYDTDFDIDKNAYPTGVEIVERKIFADTANKKGQHNDYTVLMHMGKGSDGKVYILDVYRKKHTIPELIREAPKFYFSHVDKLHGRMCSLGMFSIEDKQSGTGLIQALQELGSIPVGATVREDGRADKVQRLNGIIAYIEAGMVGIPKHANWVNDFLAECNAFTPMMTHAHDDQIDPMVDGVTDFLGTGDLMERFRALAGG
jgi:predicted phage terminase large subunit-like protein